MRSPNLGSYLKEARRKRRLTAVQVAQTVEIDSPLRVLAWERNHGEVLPLIVLKKLITLYDLNVELVLDLVLHYQISRLDGKFQNWIGRE